MTTVTSNEHYNLTEHPIAESDIKDIDWEDSDRFWVDVEVFQVTLNDGTKLTIDTKEVSDAVQKAICDWLFNNFEPVPDTLDPCEWELENELPFEDEEEGDTGNVDEWSELLAYAEMRSEQAKDLYEQYIDTLTAY
ncbi:hypothetical protein ACE1B6_24135 [Aerosakkonemataceae cyanobacterium BLCC-F154]|uniref:Uncharacterized protein n=1 Tax=Floridaenema fluviatile BLCC-F154 TaxID=3153640 RepID=A0ABV4YIK1_9CYAN